MMPHSYLRIVGSFGGRTVAQESRIVRAQVLSPLVYNLSFAQVILTDEVHAPKWVDDRVVIVNGTFNFDAVRMRVEAGDRSEFGLSLVPLAKLLTTALRGSTVKIVTQQRRGKRPSGLLLAA
ncbi:hypothetical protein PM082_013214 [Marasmius tenuissimus]|nr:hypothetical protein PM082_013214 [Marasmius tenuissimus]